MTGNSQTDVIALGDIKDAGAQMRVDMRPEIVAEYADEMLAGTIFPPVVLYQDGETHWLADGYHRVDAARKIGLGTISATIHEGTSRDAILHGIGGNAVHGLRRTQADKRRAVERLLTDAERGRGSGREGGESAVPRRGNRGAGGGVRGFERDRGHTEGNLGGAGKVRPRPL